MQFLVFVSSGSCHIGIQNPTLVKPFDQMFYTKTKWVEKLKFLGYEIFSKKKFENPKILQTKSCKMTSRMTQMGIFFIDDVRCLWEGHLGQRPSPLRSSAQRDYFRLKSPLHFALL